MTKLNMMRRATVGTAIIAVLAASVTTVMPTQAAMAAPPSAGSYRPSRQVLLSVGEGEVVSLPRAVADVWTSNPGVADVNVTSPRQLGLFGKGEGEATVIATAADGTVVWGAHVRVSQNISSVDQMLKAAMPDANISVTHVGQLAVLNGTVASPAESAQVETLVKVMLNPGIDVTSPGAMLKVLTVNRLKTATPLQVMLQVRIAEVSRSLARDIGVNLASADFTSGFKFAVGQGRTITPNFTPGGPIGTADEAAEGLNAVIPNSIGSSLFGAGKLLGVDILGALDLAETDGKVHTLAEPNLVALSGETASFLAGGEFPIPSSNGINGTAIEFKQYGVSLAFTPYVLEGGRISMRVRPEVSELSDEGSIQINGFRVPSLTTRRVETTVELGSGQSFMIGGLLRNSSSNSIEKAPVLGNLPIIGALFRSTQFRRGETELVIVVTPYLVKPVNASQIALPTDGFRSSTTAERVMLGTSEYNKAVPRPGPTMAPSRNASPGMGGVASVPARQLPAPAQPRQAEAKATRPQSASATPGFSF
ncbi:MAG TPA: type II and III secretion system protein family protein [Allosphingosinicella sp.]|jgi:pilus assembly protein CpaC|nr:type II and III secretion system protein family protein [Allosphingosinicella sp.]